MRGAARRRTRVRPGGSPPRRDLDPTRRRGLRLALAAWLVAFLATACTRPEATGAPYGVAVLADRHRQAELAPLLDSLFAATWVTDPPERLLRWHWADPDHLDAHLVERRLLVLADGPPEGPAGRFLDDLLGAGGRDRVRQGQVFLLRHRDAYARGQLLLVLAAPDPDSFKRRLREQAAAIRLELLAAERQWAGAGLRAAARQRRLEDSLALACGFRLSLPPEWFIIQGGVDPPFLRLRRLNPDRWLTVQWTEGRDSLAAGERLRQARARLAARYWERELTDPRAGRLDTIRLNGLPAVRLSGLWRAASGGPGEPFLFHALHVPGAAGRPQGRTFYIDAEVWCPGEPRSPYLHELEALVATFAAADGEGRPIGPVQAEEN